MNKKNQNRTLFIFTLVILLSLLLGACGNKQEEQPDYVTVLSVSPTDDLAPYYTAAAETIYVEMTETALANPTETPLPPTETPTSTVSATFTIMPSATTAYVWAPVIYPTSTPGTITVTNTATTAATTSDFACSITAQGIADNTEFSPNEEFDATWTIKNTGSQVWDASQIDYRYVSGTAMYKHNAGYDLSTSVASGDSITIVVDMVAPSSVASYESYWGVFASSSNFCTLPLRIKVVE